MSLRTVEWSSAVKLTCSECLPAAVSLCIRTELIIPNPLLEFLVVDGVTYTIEASLISMVSLGKCGYSGMYRYAFEYDDSLLVEGTELICTDISGAICTGCVTSYIEDLTLKALIQLLGYR